jgi:hypothetical protein
MKAFLPELEGWNQGLEFESAGPCIGRILGVTSEGKPFVDFPGNPAGPVEARSVMQVPHSHDLAWLKDLSVLLAFENNDPTLPIILGIVRDTVCATSPSTTLSRTSPREAVIDGKSIVFDAKDEIILRCGKSSITLGRDGKIVVKGAEIVSRASGTNKIKGSAVKIN